ncbi:hypothetical protein RintRC_4457 [Richelia intracellularis]|nr:hypothetical protein RintRC_4457 [Richelia intracellularis]
MILGFEVFGGDMFGKTNSWGRQNAPKPPTEVWRNIYMVLMCFNP